MSYIGMSNYTRSKGKQISPHFTIDEFRCKHCGEVLLNKELPNKLEELRTYLGDKPINIISAYRCLSSNYSIGSSNSSLHTSGNAVDFVLDGESNAIEVLLKVKNIFNRAGLCQSKYGENSFYIHVEIGTPMCYWLSYYDKYKKKKVYVYFKNIDHLLAAIRKDTQIDWFNVVI